MNKAPRYEDLLPDLSPHEPLPKKTITGRDGFEHPVSTQGELRDALERCAEDDAKWNNYGVSSVCIYALNEIKRLEKLLAEKTE